MRRASIGFATLVLGLVAAFGNAQAPVPFINQPLVPDAMVPDGPDFTLTVNGTGFVSNSTVNWNGSPLATTFVNGSQLRATVPAANVATVNTGFVTVITPGPGGGTSNTVFFTVADERGSAVAFSLASSPHVGSYTESVAVGDFNRDGKLDLAVVDECGTAGYCGFPGRVSILLGDGIGNFTLTSSWGAGYRADSVAVGDFNGDGNLDLAVANDCNGGPYSCYMPGNVSILLGDGTGNFTGAAGGVGAAGNGSPSVAVGDFNRDGNLDLAVADEGDSLVVIDLGDGTGGFPNFLFPGVGSSPESVAVGDFNGDGKLDLAVTGSSTTAILLGDGTGNFTAAPPVAVGGYAVATGDFNGDGNLDLAVTGSSTTAILLGDGTGNFTLASSLTVGGWSVATGDFNGDGDLDLAVPGGILLGDGTGNFTLGSPPGIGGDSVHSIATGDFNGDGELDVAVVNWNGDTASILLQLPPGLFITPTSLNFGSQQIFTASEPENVSLTNTGTATLDITSIVASDSFYELNNCGSSLAVGAQCNINVFFSPHATGTITGTVTITDNASDSPQTVSLTGAGTMVGLSPSTVSFDPQTVGTTGAAQTVTMTNHGYRALSVGFGFRGSNPGDFAQTNTCGNSLAAGASCTISVTFTPQARGSRTATLDVVDNGGGSPQVVTLRGYGM